MTVIRFPTSERRALSDVYAQASSLVGGVCPIEAGVLGFLADNECGHGRLPTDRSPACGCWPGERAAKAKRVKAKERRRAA